MVALSPSWVVQKKCRWVHVVCGFFLGVACIHAVALAICLKSCPGWVVVNKNALSPSGVVVKKDALSPSWVVVKHCPKSSWVVVRKLP